MPREAVVRYVIVRERGKTEPVCALKVPGDRQDCTNDAGEVTCHDCLEYLSGYDAAEEVRAEHAAMDAIAMYEAGL